MTTTFINLNIFFLYLQYYLNDTFGLKTLDSRKAIDIYVIPGVYHVYWYRNMTVFKNAIEPYLT